jgi:hypothetical protein
MDMPEACSSKSDTEILQDIKTRDDHEKPLVDALLLDEVNVIHVERSIASPDMDRILAKHVAGILVAFKEGKPESNFGTKSIAI